VVLSLGLFGYLDGGVLCDVHCEAALADNADFALAAGVVASAEPSFGTPHRLGRYGATVVTDVMVGCRRATGHAYFCKH
jgi:hypothetical protein